MANATSEQYYILLVNRIACNELCWYWYWTWSALWHRIFSSPHTTMTAATMTTRIHVRASCSSEKPSKLIVGGWSGSRYMWDKSAPIAIRCSHSHYHCHCLYHCPATATMTEPEYKYIEYAGIFINTRLYRTQPVNAVPVMLYKADDYSLQPVFGIFA